MNRTELCAHAVLARQHRSATLRAMAGRLAHQIRNPLAAIQAVCSSLRTELQELDQQQRIDLTLQEIDRLLQYVTATVQSVAEKPEKPLKFDAVKDLLDVIHIIQNSSPHLPKITLIGDQMLTCRLPRNAYRVAVYSLLDQIVTSFKPQSANVEVAHSDGRALIQFTAFGEPDNEHSNTHPQLMIDQASSLDAIDLLVAERFARDIGGRLACSVTAEASQVFTLDLPCNNV